MSMDRLIKEGSIHPFNATQDEVDRAIEIARRDLSLAEGILGESLTGLTPSPTMLCYKLAEPMCFALDTGLPVLKHTRLPLSSCGSLWMNLLRNQFPTLMLYTVIFTLLSPPSTSMRSVYRSSLI